jgi:hypothetical protein
MAFLCIHNFLIERRSEACTPSAFADWEDADHWVIEGAWRRHGLWSLEGDVNPTISAKEQCNLLRVSFVSPAGQVPWLEDHI